MNEELVASRDSFQLRIAPQVRRHFETDLKRFDQELTEYFEKNSEVTVVDKMEVKPILVENLPFGVANVSLMGVAHADENALSNRKPLHNFVAEKDIILSEFHPQNDPFKFSYTFYSNILREALWDNKVPVISVDPNLHPDVDKEYFSQVNERIRQLQDSVVTAALTTACVGAGMDVNQVIRYFRKKTVSRRQFLSGTAMTLASLFLAHDVEMENVRTWAKWPRTHEFGSMMTMNERDMRDVYVAYAIMAAAKRLPPGSNIGAIYGADHLRDLIHYLESPNELFAKFALYTALFPGTFPGLDVLIPENAEMTWKKVPIQNFEEKN